MSVRQYVVWDASKEKGSTVVLDDGESYGEPRKKPMRYVRNTGLTPQAICHLICDTEDYVGKIISPGEFERRYQRAVDEWARQCMDADIEVAQPVVWTAVES